MTAPGLRELIAERDKRERAEAEVARLLAREAELYTTANNLINDRAGDGPYTLVKSELFKKLSAALHSTGERQARVIAAAMEVNRAAAIDVSTILYYLPRDLAEKLNALVRALDWLCQALAALKEPTDG
jgi:hypothetical protein